MAEAKTGVRRRPVRNIGWEEVARVRLSGARSRPMFRGAKLTLTSSPGPTMPKPSARLQLATSAGNHSMAECVEASQRRIYKPQQ
jgi:hypothetical protein